MAIITQNRLWNKIQTRQEINNETGAIEVYAIGAGLFGVDALIASSQGQGSDWTLPNPQTFTNTYNKKNNTQSSVQELERAFFLEGFKVFDNDRANVLNSPSSYDDPRDGLIARQRFFNQNTPRMVDPSTSKNVNQDGKKTTEQVEPDQTVVTTDTTLRDSPSVREGSTATDTTKTTQNPNDQGNSKNTSAVPGGNQTTQQNFGLLRYPLSDLSVGGEIGITYDYIKIGIMDYVPSLSGQGGSTSQRYDQGSIGTIILPMISGLQSTNGVSWGANNMNAIEKVIGESVFGLLDDVGENGLTMEVIKKNMASSLQAGRNTIMDIVSQKPAVAALLAGYVVGNTAVATRSSGAVINPNMELLFGGPQLRSFSFNFQFAPRSGREADVVAKITRAFKAAAAPKIETTGGIFLKTPNVFNLEYIYDGSATGGSGQVHPYLNKIKTCALTAVGVKYNPGGKYMTYVGDQTGGAGSMVQTILSLTFTELEPIYDIDYKNDATHLVSY